MSPGTASSALDPDALVADLRALVRVPSVTGDERAVMDEFVGLAAALGLEAELWEHDLAALRAAPGYPGEEALRTELVGAVARLPGRDPHAPRLAIAGHLDVVGPGAESWHHDPWAADLEDGCVHGCGAADMKAGVAAALHALAAVARSGARPAGDVVLLAVASEEDGGLGAFAALERDDAFAACLVPEPTGFELVCAQAGALTFTGTVRGRAAHAALRLEGVSAIDRYLPVHAALADHERHINAGMPHPLMARHALPYPVLVGRLSAGRWSSQVPDLLEFEGRVGVPVGTDLDAARADVERVVVAAAGPGGPPPELRWTGGQFASGQTDPADPFVGLVSAAAQAELGAPPPLGGVTWGSDMRLFTARGIPTVMIGTRGIERAHAVDERVAVDEVVTLARILTRVIASFG
ncbi:MAG: acetylornithine deacetylase [Thermoleophilaceae bacterium]|nr:acetylornithine deacetylase [Thermoleophilaceae bacterium]